jgi:uncharacterized cysteine cluster protein YcgN (CxxCxxCC family)
MGVRPGNNCLCDNYDDGNINNNNNNNIVKLKVKKINIIVSKAKYVCVLKIKFIKRKWKTLVRRSNELKRNAREGMLGRLIANLTQETFLESGEQKI